MAVFEHVAQYGNAVEGKPIWSGIGCQTARAEGIHTNVPLNLPHLCLVCICNIQIVTLCGPTWLAVGESPRECFIETENSPIQDSFSSCDIGNQ
jgi:hypothetical protein